MRHQTSFLADFALAHGDDRVYVVGGFLDRATFDAFPAVVPQLSLVLKVVFDRDECDVPHVITFTAQDTDQNVMVGPAHVPVSLLRSPNRGVEDVPFTCVFNMRDITFVRPGNYTFTVAVDDAPVQTLQLAAALISETTPRFTTINASTPILRSDAIPASTPAQNDRVAQPRTRGLLAEGYAAFVQGRLDDAEAAFRELVALSPGDAQALNNLGFVLVTTGQAEEAMAFFDRARDFGYAEPEVLEVNRACALYAMGDYPSALDGFVSCFRSARLRQTMVLLAIQADKMLPIQLATAAEYVALVALNAAWCELRSGTAVRGFSEIAVAGRLAFASNDDARGTFDECLTALERAT